MNMNASNDRFLSALQRIPERPKTRPVTSAMAKLGKGKKLKGHEFRAVYDLLFKPGPNVKYSNPEKWERVSRDFSARNP